MVEQSDSNTPPLASKADVRNWGKYNLRSLLLHLSSLLGHITQSLNLGALLRGGSGVPNLLLHLSGLLSYISQSLDLCALLGGGHLLAACWRRICLALLWGSRWCRETYYWTLLRGQAYPRLPLAG